MRLETCLAQRPARLTLRVRSDLRGFGMVGGALAFCVDRRRLGVVVVDVGRAAVILARARLPTNALKRTRSGLSEQLAQAVGSCCRRRSSRRWRARRSASGGSPRF